MASHEKVPSQAKDQIGVDQDGMKNQNEEDHRMIGSTDGRLIANRGNQWGTFIIHIVKVVSSFHNLHCNLENQEIELRYSIWLKMTSMQPQLSSGSLFGEK